MRFDFKVQYIAGSKDLRPDAFSPFPQVRIGDAGEEACHNVMDKVALVVTWESIQEESGSNVAMTLLIKLVQWEVANNKSEDWEG